MLHSLILTAVALVILYGAEDARAEKAVPFGLESPVIDGLGLLDLAVRPLPDTLRRGDHDLYGIKMQRVLGLHKQTVKLFQRNLLGSAGIAPSVPCRVSNASTA